MDILLENEIDFVSGGGDSNESFSPGNDDIVVFGHHFTSGAIRDIGMGALYIGAGVAATELAPVVGVAAAGAEMAPVAAKLVEAGIKLSARTFQAGGGFMVSNGLRIMRK
ncbi:hypothetical protein HLH34_18925 [Gluconacetobacter azotocaptans]|uniref:Uncharacterized protein n=1 Tax=Gluconacetobacter azotocaptans TaxID=142834 RepID=A0A7W4JWD0_9PROT|nr:hypothetical protein [Gluconacetobacter azotocaptans]MBB2192007.1 hypothetical protein [Gluconacetobacter azotocaptans]GBQ33088.1 hypothetical protein AA13594_2540 [Gluconacetobacter azotocaptans DSM 13594]